ncbi:MAG TPA: hypothetical protein VEW92_03500 [Nitrososphaeraceae archaeon]|nr:hypothetical protein [Nitrososphaeraceae archaeon]
MDKSYGGILSLMFWMELWRHSRKRGMARFFYPTKDTKRLRYYSKDLFFGMVKVTPQNFEFLLRFQKELLI